MTTPPPDIKQYMEFDEDDPRFQVRLLSLRVDTLTKEKEEIEARERDFELRIAAMEKSFQRGFGALVIVPIVGTLVGFFAAYGKVIFAPWMNSK